MTDVTDLCWSPDGTRVASCGVDNKVIIWNVMTASKSLKSKLELTLSDLQLLSRNFPATTELLKVLRGIQLEDIYSLRYE